MAKRLKTRNIKTHIEGMDEVIKLLEEMGEEAESVIDDAAKSGAQIVLKRAKQIVPVDTGVLKDSLILKKSKIKNAKVKSVYTVSKKSGAKHFAPVELGTSKMKAQPFIRPAFDENLKNVASKINEEILRAIGRIR